MLSEHTSFNSLSSEFNDDKYSVEEKSQNIQSLLKYLSSESTFEEDSWFFDLRIKAKNYQKDKYTVYFKNIPKQYTEAVKLLVLIFATNSVSSAIDFPTKIVHLFNFCKIKNISIENFDYKHFQLLEDYINNLKHEKSGEFYHYDTRFKVWKFSIKFFSTLNWITHLPYLENLKGRLNPIKKFARKDNRESIDEYDLAILDDYFYNHEKKLHFKLAYWVIRFFPFRIGEVLNLEIDCLKDLNNEFAMLTIPIQKNNGGYKEPKLETELIDKRDSYQKLLIELIQQQQLFIKNLSKSQNTKFSLLFHYEAQQIKGQVHLLSTAYFAKYLRGVCKKLDITSSITIHQFRTTGTTLRAEFGFTAVQLKELLHTDIDNVATYSKPRKKKVQELQRKFLGEEVNKVFFNGRILNSQNTNMEKRILQNPLAHKLPDMGFCIYENSCGQHYDCLDCKYLLPDYELLDYYKETALIQLQKANYWAEKGNKLFERDSLHRATLFTKLYEKTLLAKEGTKC